MEDVLGGRADRKRAEIARMIGFEAVDLDVETNRWG
jgi:hypothetical protein